MRYTLPISLFLHLGILLAAIVVLPAPEEFRVTPQEALPVEIISIEDVSKRMAMTRDAPEKPVEKPAPKIREPQPKPQPKPAREKVEARPEPKPAPEPEPEPVKKAEPALAPDPADLKKLMEKVAEPEPKPEKAEPAPAPKPKAARPAPKPRARPRVIRKLAALHRKKRQKPKKAHKPRKDAIDEIAALLNKVDETPRARPPEAEETGTPRRGPADMAGTDATLSADLVDALRQKVESCWNVPAGVRDAEGLRVRVRFQMSPEGLVTGGPEVLNAMAHPAFDAAARSAVRAVLACQPYDFLPPEKYEAWKDIILNFDPSRMLAVN